MPATSSVDYLVAEIERLEREVSLARVKVNDLEAECVKAEAALEVCLSEDGVGAAAVRSDGGAYVYADDLKDGKSSVNHDAVDALAERLSKFGLAPVATVGKKYPTKADIERHAAGLRDAGISLTDLIDYAPTRCGLRFQRVES